jgi:hypothetical protein
MEVFLIFFRINYQKHIPTKEISGKFCPMVRPEELEALKQELTGICLFVTSTFGNGDAPKTGEALAEWIDLQLTKMEAFQHTRMSRSSTTDKDTERPEYEILDDPEHISGPSKSLYRRIGMAKKQILDNLRLTI